MKRTVIALLCQFFACFITAVAAYLLKPVAGLHFFLLWVALPLTAFISAFTLTGRNVNPYATWLLPPLALTGAAYLVTMGFLPSGGALLLTALLGILGAATSESYKKWRK